MNRSSMNVQKSPYEVETKVEETESKLDELQPSERIYVFGAKSFSSSNAGISRLVIETRNGSI
jgi:hypothetical protein